MRWSFRILTLYGVDVFSHASFPLVLVWAAWQGADNQGGVGGALFGVLSVGLLFVCVLLHELGHSLEAKRLGLPVRRITLFPLGGVAELGLIPEKPVQEFRIALAGPAVNLVLGLVLGGVAAVWVILSDADPRRAIFAAIADPSALGLLVYLVGANLSLAIFNLIPAFPMDGGRVLRASLATFLNLLLATRIAAIAGYLIAGGLIVVGLASLAMPPEHIPAGLLLVLVGLFVIVGAGYEEYWLRRRVKLSRLRAGTAMQSPTWTVAPGDMVTPLLNVHSFHMQPALPVVLGRRVVGLILEKDVQAALKKPGRLTIAHVMRADFPRVRASDTLWQALELLTAYGYPALPVVNNGRFEGLITQADVRREASRPYARSTGTTVQVPGLRTVPLGENRDL
jgi:Zn-dependent protease/predicted transcriptional regulator